MVGGTPMDPMRALHRRTISLESADRRPTGTAGTVDGATAIDQAGTLRQQGDGRSPHPWSTTRFLPVRFAS